MKILSVEQIREADSFTIQNEGISSLALMERAALACNEWIREKFVPGTPLSFLCGTGNNGADGLVMALHLTEDYPVTVQIIRFSENESGEFKENYARFIQTGKINPTNVLEIKGLETPAKGTVIIDCLLGSGLNKRVMGFLSEVITQVNSWGCKIISIDNPSGLPDYPKHLSKEDQAVKSDHVLCFDVPRMPFLFAQNKEYCKDFSVLPIGFSHEFISSCNTKNFLIGQEELKGIKPGRNKFSHKGIFGHALLIAGSFGKSGAAVLAARACLKSGPGLLTVKIPMCTCEIMQTSLPEAMVLLDTEFTHITGIPELSSFDAVGIGPGLGKEKQTENTLKLLIQNFQGPMVLDADALNILSENKTWLSYLPQGSIITPHPREFDRIAGASGNDYDRHQRQLELSFKYGIYIVLKGAHTCITTPLGKSFFNKTGNPGMATAGTGDVLTGIILGLITQDISPLEACLLGVHVHGKAGDLALERESFESLVAGDIIQYLGKAFNTLD